MVRYCKNGRDKTVSEDADIDTVIHRFYDKEQTVVNSYSNGHNHCHKTRTDRNRKSLYLTVI